MQQRERGFILPLALLMMLVVAGTSTTLAVLAREGSRRAKTEQVSGETYLAAEGSGHQLISEMAVNGALFDQLAPLGDKPAGYTEYAPSSYTGTNGIPTCSGPACHRSFYPIGGGLLKNFGPLNGAGGSVDESLPIHEQLADPATLEPDVTLGALKGWSQLERLDETLPGPSEVGGNLSNSMAEGGNARSVRYRLTAASSRTLKGRNGTSVLVSVLEMPVR